MSDDIQECRPSARPDKKAGIGMPTTLYLQDFGDIIFQAFGEYPYHVGSSLTENVWRDVDVRVMLDDETYAAMGFGDPKDPHVNPKWCAYVKAFTALGQKITGLPIDFQIDQTSYANEWTGKTKGSLRSCLIGGSLRRQNVNSPEYKAAMCALAATMTPAPKGDL